MQIVYAPTVLKKIKKIKASEKAKVRKKIESLKVNPLAGKLLKGEFKGFRSLKSWPLRIIYSFDGKLKIINIVAIDYRGGVYK